MTECIPFQKLNIESYIYAFVHYRHLGEYSVDIFMDSDSDKHVKMYLEFKIATKSHSIVLGPVTFGIQWSRHDVIHNQENLWQPSLHYDL